MPSKLSVEDRILALKLRRLEQLNEKLKESLKKDRIPASRAAALIIETSQDISDPLVPSVWHLPPEQNRYRVYHELCNRPTLAGCCTVV